jgi:predicted Zn-dependent peptidase
MFVGALSAHASSETLLSQVEKTKHVHQINSSIATIEYQLPNGLAVFLTENPKAPNVIVSHWVKAGSLHEKPGITGIAHLFEHMMFRPLAPGQPTFFDYASKMGGNLNANTRFESTYFFTAVPSERLNELLQRESDRFQKLVVTKELLDVERKAVWSEYSVKFDSNPIIDLWFQIYFQGFKGHPFGWTIIGFREDLEKITAEDCNAFFQKYYKPNNIGLFVTGNFKSGDALKEIVKLYGDWKPGEKTVLPEPYSAKTKEIVSEGKLESKARFFLAGFRVPYFNQENAPVQTLANYILFDENNGLLRKRLVDEKKWAAEVSEFNFDYDNGMQKVGIVALPDAKLTDIKSEVEGIAKQLETLSDKEFETYKMNLYIRMGEGVEKNSQLSDVLALTWGKYGNIDLTTDFTTKPLNVTKEQVAQFVGKYFKADNLVFLTHKGQLK